jgi:hypothetical protein
MQQNAFSEAVSSSTSQKIPFFYKTRSFITVFTKSCIKSQVNLIRTAIL